MFGDNCHLSTDRLPLIGTHVRRESEEIQRRPFRLITLDSLFWPIDAVEALSTWGRGTVFTAICRLRCGLASEVDVRLG